MVRRIVIALVVVAAVAAVGATTVADQDTVVFCARKKRNKVHVHLGQCKRKEHQVFLDVPPPAPPPTCEECALPGVEAALEILHEIRVEVDAIATVCQ